MTTDLRCEKCGHTIRVPREAAGKMAKCPCCQNEIYIPTPENELEELPLAEEDPAEEEREARLLAERRRLDMELAKEDSVPSAAAEASTYRSPSPTTPTHGKTTVKSVVIAYLTAMRDSDLARAEQALALLAPHKPETLRVIDRLATDQIPPPEMAHVPPGVYQGFLKTLRARL